MTKDSLGSFLLVYASQTGQAKSIAEEIAERAEQHGLEARLHCISTTEKKFWLERERLVVLISSTTGDGEPPETASKFYRRLHKKTLPTNHLQHLNYTLLGLGDSNYSNFCNCGKNLDKRLEKIGAKRFYASGFADDAVGLEIVVEPWIDGLFPALRRHLGMDTDDGQQSACNVQGTSSTSQSDVINPNSNSDKLEEVTHNSSSNKPETRTKNSNITESDVLVNNDGMQQTQLDSNKATITLDRNKGSDRTSVQSKTCDSKSNSSIFDTTDSTVDSNNSDSKVRVSNAFAGQGDTGTNNVNNKFESNLGNSSGELKGSDVNTSSTNGKNENIFKSTIREVNSSVTFEEKQNPGKGDNSSTQSTKDTETKKITNLDGCKDVESSSPGSLVSSVEPLSSSNLSLPLCPAPYIQIEFHPEEDVDLQSLPLQNGCDFPSSASGVHFVPVVSAVKMTSEDAVKTALKVQLDISRTGWSYQPGDAVGVVCPNNKEEVQLLIDRLSAADGADVTCSLSLLVNTKKKNAKIPLHYPAGRSTLRYILTHCCDIRDVPKKAFLRALIECTTNSREKRRLQELCSKQGSHDFTQYVRTPNIGVLDLLKAFPTCKPGVEILLEHCPRLLPRPYSAASCEQSNAGIFEFVFNIVEIPAENGKHLQKKGMCTGWLDDVTKSIQHSIVDESGLGSTGVSNKLEGLRIYDTIEIPVFLRKSSYFRPPDDISVPYIMIGPGTGVAPFVGFLGQRKYLLSQESPSATIGCVWLFYGCRHKNRDFLYRKQLEDFVSQGVLQNLLVSLSREEQSEYSLASGNTETIDDTLLTQSVNNSQTTEPCLIKYVQDNLRKYGSNVVELICDKGARVYVCGDAKGMARDVNAAFIEILQKHRGMEEKEASDFVMKMRINKSYLEDVWT